MSEITENHTITNVGAGVAKAIMHSNPITGFFQAIYDEYASRQWQQRRNKWEGIFEEKLQNIKDEIDLAKIENIPNFAQILLSAGQGAMSDIEEDKVALYVNAVVNSIKKEDIDDTKKHIFLNMLRDFTLLHITLLQTLSKNLDNGDFKNGFQMTIRDKSQTAEDIILARNIQLRKQKDILHIFTHDLYEKHLLQKEYPLQELASFGKVDKQTTDLGDEFLDFIAEYSDI